MKQASAGNRVSNLTNFGQSSKIPTLETEGCIKDTGLAIHNVYCCRLHLTFLDNKSINQYIMEMFVDRTKIVFDICCTWLGGERNLNLETKSRQVGSQE